ncbi:unnamed protein product [Rotaria sp. Silwood1]|nr:unnamed protein product [Rotaria sp. Silwood1]CAF1682418.1 unnamed protein product [Rotaria sp. Silwood1]CAF5003288.1 unnamed protein product [Rotaria sp. Silwood1]
MFWARGKNKICAALIAVLIYRRRGRETNDNAYYQSADEFENLAVQILNKFHQTNARECITAIIRKIPAYGNVTWLELAIKAEAKQFIAQRAVQEVLNNMWYGYVDQGVKFSTIIFSTLMLWYSGLLSYQNKLVEANEQITLLDKSRRKSSLFQRNQTTRSEHMMNSSSFLRCRKKKLILATITYVAKVVLNGFKISNFLGSSIVR